MLHTKLQPSIASGSREKVDFIVFWGFFCFVLVFFKYLRPSWILDQVHLKQVRQ